MAIEVLSYKKQGDGRDSWTVFDTVAGTKYVVYEQPDKPLSISHVDITTLTNDQLLTLKMLLDTVEVPVTRMAMASVSTEQVRDERKFVSKYPSVVWPWYKRWWVSIKLFFKKLFS